MRTNRTIGAALTTVSLAALAVGGIVGSARAGETGLLTLFVIVLVLVAGLAQLIMRPNERIVPLRGDLARWLDSMSAVTGEPPEAIAARGLSAYRAQLADPADG
jgi:hypothetical protein